MDVTIVEPSDPFYWVEPCEPDCTPERHAYHQGQWDMATRMSQQATPDSESEDMRKKDLPLASPGDFHKQVARIIERVWMVGVNHESHTIPEMDKLLDKATDEVTALVQTLVPEEMKAHFPDDVGGKKFASGFNFCRTQILSAIKGVKADE